MRWSSVADTRPVGTRTGSVQCTPSDDEASTMSFGSSGSTPVHPVRKRQSGQATYTLPSASTSADGSGPARMPTGFDEDSSATIVLTSKLAPPSVERTDSIAFRPRYGMTSVPFGWTSGCQPVPSISRTTRAGRVHVSPPSLETETASAESNVTSAHTL